MVDGGEDGSFPLLFGTGFLTGFSSGFRQFSRAGFPIGFSTALFFHRGFSPRLFHSFPPPGGVHPSFQQLSTQLSPGFPQLSPQLSIAFPPSFHAAFSTAFPLSFPRGFLGSFSPAFPTGISQLSPQFSPGSLSPLPP